MHFGSGDVEAARARVAARRRTEATNGDVRQRAKDVSAGPPGP